VSYINTLHPCGAEKSNKESQHHIISKPLAYFSRSGIAAFHKKEYSECVYTRIGIGI
jgi:hypothetical protein